VILASIGDEVLAASLPVYGSPGFTPGVGGYIASIGSVDFINESIAVNNNGVAVARANRFDGAGHSPDSGALRWSATSADVLGDLGTSGGIGHTNVQAINNSGVAIGPGGLAPFA
jgi:hypothetical protein